MKTKSSDELRKVIKEDSGFVEEARQEAQLELQERESSGTIDLENIERSKILQKGENIYQDFIKSINTETHFGWTPEHKEVFNTNIPFELISAVGVKTAEQLEWDVVYYDSEVLEIKRPVDGKWTEKLTIGISKNGEVSVVSKSITNGMLDMGRNSKCVKLFIHVYQELE